jgi:hypothetical protein
LDDVIVFLLSDADVAAANQHAQKQKQSNRKTCYHVKAMAIKENLDSILLNVLFRFEQLIHESHIEERDNSA